MLNLYSKTPIAGDCSVGYGISGIKKDTTVRDIIRYALSRREWGTIRIKTKNGEYSVDFRNSRLRGHVPDSILDKVVSKDCTACGGWSNMNYYLKTLS